MAAYVDDARIKHRGKVWSHLMADNEGELHTFAQHIGLKLSWFQGDHYDVTAFMRRKAIKAGALAVSTEHLIELRRSKWTS